MNFNEIIAELPLFTFEERQILLAEHRADPSSSVPLDEMKRRLRVQNPDASG